MMTYRLVFGYRDGVTVSCDDASLLLGSASGLGVTGDLRLLGGDGGCERDERVHDKRFEDKGNGHAWRVSVTTQLVRRKNEAT